MRKAFYLILLFAGSTFTAACGSDDGEGTSSSKVALIASISEAFDITNKGNASDITLSIQAPLQRTQVDGFKIIISRSDRTANLGVEEAAATQADRALDLGSSDILSNIRLPASLQDIDGHAIENSNTYHIYVLTLVAEGNEQFISGLSEPVELDLDATDLVETIASGFSGSGGVLVDDDGFIYVSDFGTGDRNGTTIRKFSPDGSSSELFADGLLGPTGGAFNSKGDLFWSSYSGGKVHKIDASGNVSTFVQIPGPVAIAIDQSDNLLVASCDSNVIKKISPNGASSDFARNSAFNCLNGLVLDLSGNLYTCNFEDGAIFKVTPTGTVSRFATIPTASSVNMAIDGNFIYLTARKAHRIYKIALSDGAVSLLAGTGTRGAKDGAALSSQFSLPNGIALSNDGSKLYINDVAPNSGVNSNGANFNPNTLRVISLEGN